MPIGGFAGLPAPDPEEMWSIVEACAKIGYKGMDNDLSQIPGDLEENYKRFTALGLTPLTTGCPMNLTEAEKDIKSTIEQAKKQNITRITAFASSVIFNPDSSYDDMCRDIESMNRLVAVLADEGMTLAYHNHYQEFTTFFKGSAMMNHMLLGCDPRLTFDLDVGWVTVGGENPVAVMQRLKNRIAVIHLKDFYDLEQPKDPDVGFLEKKGFTSLGSGVVDIAGVLEEMDSQGIEWGIVEQDNMRNLDRVQSLTASYLRMKESGLFEC